jgi:glutamate-1-semialdehyde 2,1-aminomutase
MTGATKRRHAGSKRRAERRYPGSRRQIERARRTLASGVATAMRAAQRPYPLVFERGEGSRLTDVDGNSYIDYVLGFGPLLLGHCPAPIVEAVVGQVRRGLTFGAQHRLEAELAERIVATAPCAELVCFSSTGSEAVHAALRIARAASGRRKIVKFEGHYHGWIDPVYVSTPGLNAAAPAERAPLRAVAATEGQGASDEVLVARWNDPNELEKVLAEHENEVAAVIMEPVQCNGGVIEPLPGYLERARELTTASGALLIFDEVVTGYRLALGGAQECHRVVPDLATYGKAIAGGMPLSAVAGRADVMAVVDDGGVPHVGTFNCNPPAAAAAVAAIDVYSAGSPELYDHLEQRTATLRAGISDAAASAGLPLVTRQVGSLLQTDIAEPGNPVRSYADTRDVDRGSFAAFTELMLERGIMVLPRGWWFLSTAHSEADVAETIDAATGAFAELAETRRFG